MLSPSRPYGVGVDCHSQFVEICVLVPHTGKEMHKHSFAAQLLPDQLAAAKLEVCSFLRQHGQEPTNLSYALESSGVYHFPVVRTWQGCPIIVNPALAAGFKARKTDKWDASVLAYQCMTGLFSPSFVLPEQTEILRLLMRHRRKLLRWRTQLYNTVGTRLSQWYCPLCGQTTRSNAIRTIVEDCQRGKFCSGNSSFQLAQNVPQRVWDLLTSCYQKVDGLNAEIKAIEKEATGYADVHLHKLLQTIPGVGEITALTWQAEVCPVERFRNGKAVTAFCGFDPTPKISAGKTVSAQCRHGNKFIRSAVVQAAQTVLNGRSNMAEYGHRLKRHRCVQVNAVGRRIVNAMFYVSLHKKEWVDEGPKERRAGSPGGGEQQRPSGGRDPE